jgi:hypothetical protein
MESRASIDHVSLSWRVTDGPGHTLVELSGEIDENVDFADLRSRLRGPVVFQLSEVRRINSCGVREWVNFVRELASPEKEGGGVTDLVFTACSPAIVTQLNMIYNFRGQAVVRSFLAPYVCKECDHETEKLLDVRQHFSATGPGRNRTPPEFTCEKCSGRLEFDDLPERYLSFLNDS